MPSNPKNTRKCFVCREHADKSELVRFVLDADGSVVLDRDGKKDGRGVWVHAKGDCIEKLKKKKLLSAAFKRNVGEAIYSELEQYDE